MNAEQKRNEKLIEQLCSELNKHTSKAILTNDSIEIRCSPKLLLQILHQFMEGNISADIQEKINLLSPCEKDVLFYIAELKTDKEIADILLRSPLTIRTHEANIRLKTDIHGRNALKKFALSAKPYLKLSLNNTVKNEKKIKNGGG